MLPLHILHRSLAGLFLAPSHPTGVYTYCWYGNVTTEHAYVFATDDLSTDPNITYGDGDSVVTDSSLRVCDDWDGAMTSVELFQGVSHSGFLWNTTILNRILGILTS